MHFAEVLRAGVSCDAQSERFRGSRRNRSDRCQPGEARPRASKDASASRWLLRCGEVKFAEGLPMARSG